MREPAPRLGRGLALLLGQAPEPDADRLRSVPLEMLEPNPFQPREAMEPAAITELAQSIRGQGVLQPVLARPLPGPPHRLQLIAGERRWRAAREAGLSEIPCLVQEMSDEQAALLALVENMQREDLGALEEASGFRRMVDQFRLNQEDLARAVGKSRSHVANTMRLLNLPEEVQDLMRQGQLSAGHGRALLAHADPVAAARAVMQGGLNVRQTEALVLPSADRPERSETPVDPNIAALERELSERLGLRVTIADRKGAGRLTVQYRSLDQLDGLIALLTPS